MASDVVMVIVGAGASHDAVESANTSVVPVEVDGAVEHLAYQQLKPPLTAQLAEPSLRNHEIVRRYPACEPVIAYLRDALSPHAGREATSLEEALGRYDDDADSDPVMYRHLTAMRFYLRDLLWEASQHTLNPRVSGGITNYTRLSSTMYRHAKQSGRQVVFVSFNFDVLLERALQAQVGLNYLDMKGYVVGSTFTLVKPHGSVLWEHEVVDSRNFTSHGDRPVREAIDLARPDNVSGEFRVATGLVHPLSLPSGTVKAAVPALAMPIAGKTAFAWPLDQDTYFKQLAGRVKVVVSVGWRGMEPHFVDRLRSVVAPDVLTCAITGGGRDGVAYNEAREVTSRITGEAGVVRGERSMTFDQGFSRALNEHVIADFLEGTLAR